MKFANIDNLTRSNQYSEKLKINIGDYMQLIAIDNLYRYMGIGSKDIVHMKSEDLATYKGEKLILPINFMIAKYEFSPFKFDGKMGFQKTLFLFLLD